MKYIKKYIVGPAILFLMVLLLKWFFGVFPEILEGVYQNGAFALFRYIYDYTIGYILPFPMLWISFGVIIYVIFIRKYGHKHLLSLIAQIFGHSLIVASLFYILWGWNYAQKPIAERLDLERVALDTLSLYNEATWAVEQINTLRSLLQDDSLTLSPQYESGVEMERDVRRYLSSALSLIDRPTPGRPRVRVLRPKGLLLRFKTAGIYMPYALEGHIDGGLLELEWPYTMSHEMSHAYGITDEGECNFTAFLACMHSEDPYFQYSAMIDYILYVMRDVYRANPARHKTIFSKLHAGFQADLQAMRENNQLYPDILPEIRDFMYDSYLKSNGVKAGLKSYSQFVGLVISYKSKPGNILEN